VLEVVLPDATQESVVSWLVGVPSLPPELADSVDAAIEDAGPPASVTGAVALAGLLWAASGMMSSVRSAFRAIWGSEADRPYVRGKLLDLLLVLGAGVLVVSAFGLVLVVQVVTEASSEVVQGLSSGESVTAGLGALAQLVASLTLAFLAFTLLYRVVPPVPTRIRAVAPGAAAAAVGVHLANAGFSIYLTRFGDFDDVYGPLGAVLAFLLLVYIAAVVLLLGACLAAGWPGSAPEPAAEGGETVALHIRLGRAVRALAVRNRD
jgi:membrane protein